MNQHTVVFWERLCRNPVTGRCAWVVRHIPTGSLGDAYTWSFVAVRNHWFDGGCTIKAVQGIDVTKRRQIAKAVRERGFREIRATEHGKQYVWDSKNIRRIYK